MEVRLIRRDRPRFPTGYGIEAGPEGLLEWERVESALAGAIIYWMSTVLPDGDPHLVPIWGAWTATRLYVEGGDDTRWARNLAHRPTLTVGVDHDHLQAMVSGQARSTIVSDDLHLRIADGYESKYPYRPRLGGRFWEVTPRRVLAWDTSDLNSFGSTPTRFSFEEDR